MFRRLVVFVIALTMTCAFAVTGIGLGGPTGAAAAGGNGVGPSWDNATGHARACEVHTANKGKSIAKGLQCGQGTGPSLTMSVDCTGNSWTLSGSGLTPGDQVWFYSESDGDWIPWGPVASDGTFLFQGTSFPVFDTLTLATFPAGVNANTSPGSATFVASPPYTFSCLPPSGTMVTTVNCQDLTALFAGAGLPADDEVWFYSQTDSQWHDAGAAQSGSPDDWYFYNTVGLPNAADTLTLAAFPFGSDPTTTTPDVTATPVTYSCA